MAPSYTLPQLPYSYDALEPDLSQEIMQLHHQKHHQAYVNNLNAALARYAAAEQQGDLATMIACQSAIRFNGGGHLNHTLFWTNLAPRASGGGKEPRGPLQQAIATTFGSLAELIATFNQQAAAIQGSGWGWLGYDRRQQKLVISTSANQDPLQSLVPLLGIDVWEHAYYLQYKNARPQYLSKIWNVIDWKSVEQRFAACTRAQPAR